MERIDDVAEENKALKKVLSKTIKTQKAKTKLISAAAILVLVIAVLGTAWWYGNNHGRDTSTDQIAALEASVQERDAQILELNQQIQELKETPIVVSPVAPEINLDIIKSEIQGIAELATYEYLFTDSAKFSDSKQIKGWSVPFTEKSFILRWSGVIKAGVDLEHTAIEVDKGALKVVVSVPKAEILSYSIDSDSVEVLDENDNIFNNISVNDKVQFDSKTEEAMKERAIENGLLEKAQEYAETILRSLILSDPAVGGSYTIEFIVVE